MVLLERVVVATIEKLKAKISASQKNKRSTFERLLETATAFLVK
jgi:hypothetical protein